MNRIHNKTMQKVKIPKIKIPEQDLKSFLKESLKIDPFWYDLYGIKTVDKQKVEE